MKTMKSTVARLFALCLTVAMVLSMATMGAFAEKNPIVNTTPTGTINIKGTDRDVNTSVALYQIITVNLDKNSYQPKDPMYQWVEAVGKWVAEEYPSYVKVIEDKTETTSTYTYAVTEAFSLKTSNEDEVGATAKELSAFYEALATAIKQETLLLDEPTKTTVNGTTATPVEDMPLGQYLIIADDTSTYVHKSATATLYPQWGDHDGKPETNETWYVEDANVVLKGDKGTVDKEPDKPTVSIGDVVTYTVKASVPVYPEGATATAFNVGDKMSHGLTWDKKVAVYWSENGIMHTKKAGEGDDQKEVPDPDYLVDTAKYKVVTPKDDEKLPDDTTFEVRFDYANFIKDYSDAKYVHVVYKATINEYAFEEDALGNDAYLGVNTNPYDGGSYETTPTEETVYTYGFTVTKVDEKNEALQGVEFKLYSDEKCTNEIQFVDKDNGVYTKATADQIEAGTDITTTLVTNGDGQIQVQGLTCGDYYLKETKAPNGYVLPSDVIKITLVDNKDAQGGEGPDGNLDDCTAEGSTVVKEESLVSTFAIGGDTEDGLKNIFEFKVENKKPGFNLPTTGGMGTVLFTAGGLVIMACGAALVLVTLKKKKAED
ncbi:isopeptide-forming domain-containing fimbrial protein [Pseudoflavonifractor sp. SW1122]|uniref:SpaH/EbpB family LPXTG-anchored major pilin n=1 Tax=Pseudoflavonifractor sp. SW1122 TaxID=2530044 RepID=UPI00143AB160|nr:SpaH/EbpB family LPXTG-anchored major pilin [Pseudoflavonifractor sp. SW1122]NJE74926.1 isopeptide-forming domain-containing fimbrial protein [Pseudoflavonifractor sp. SW1122]